MTRVLIVEDDPDFRAAVRGEVAEVTDPAGVAEAGDLQAARAALAGETPDVLVLDIAFPLAPGRPPDPRAGIKLLRALTELGRPESVIVLSGQDRRTAVELLLGGKVDAYLFKDWGPAEVRAHVTRGLERAALRRKTRALARDGSRRAPTPVGAGPAMRAALRKAEKVAATATTVLLQGESGTGKEVFARFLHARSPRHAGPFVAISAAALPRDLAEVELFGAKRGAYTGLDRDREGALALARGGTLFLDEIGELPLELQPKLLRALQERAFRSLGAAEEQAADFRLVCATHRDLEAMVDAGEFREDLYYRVRVFPLALPPLRDRLEDLPALVDHLIDRFNTELGRRVTGVSPAGLARLAAHSWPGNVRELANVIEYAFVLTDGPVIEVDAFPALRRRVAPGDPAAYGETHKAAMAAFERAFLEAALRGRGGNLAETAAALELPKRTLQDRMRRLGLRARDLRGGA